MSSDMDPRADRPTVPITIEPDAEVLDRARERADSMDCDVLEALQDIAEFDIEIVTR